MKNPPKQKDFKVAKKIVCIQNRKDFSVLNGRAGFYQKHFSDVFGESHNNPL